MGTSPNVFATRQGAQNNSWDRAGLFGRVRRESYRIAVSQIILNIKAQKRWSNERLGEELGVSDETIRNAENGQGNLDAVTLLNVALLFGEDAIDPVRQLYLCAPVEPKSAAEEIDEIQARLDALRAKVAQ